MFYSKAYIVQMNTDVPDAEKRMAEKASEQFESVIAQVKLALEYLDFLYVPFSKIETFDNEQLVKNRNIIRNYKEAVKFKLENIIRTGYKAISLMTNFSTDSSVEELMGSFVAQLKDFERNADHLLSILSNINSTDFKDALIAAIDSVKTQGVQLKQLVNDRILEHIDTNILAKNWDSLVNDKFKSKEEEPKLPYMIELFRQRNKI